MPSPASLARAVLAAAVLGAGLYVGAIPVGPAPALGPVLDPAHGVWSVARGGDVARRDARAALPGLGAEVRVVYDHRAVPHIFAASVDDAVRALGYVVARDRLAQMVVQTLGASSRVTELGGAAALELDREMRSLGLPRAAERTYAALAGSTGRRLVDAYAEGVNAYLRAMPRAELPLELRLAGVTPEPWRPVNSMHLFGRMGWTLAYLAPEEERARAATRVGRAAAASLFPVADPIVEPIQPNGQTAPRVERATIAPPGEPDTTALGARRSAMGDDMNGRAPSAERRHYASNNWAVAARRTRDGHALLAGDPHLDLTLPSLWYEVHLVVPGQLDVHGVTIPGAPAVIIGFNRDVAWTFTNTGADVLDFYDERVDAVDAPTRYQLDGAWKPIEVRLERYLGKDGRVIATDTVRYTHRGPMRREGDRWLSMRWTVLEPSDPVAAFLGAARARSAAEFEAAMAAHYRAPAQNMLVADRAGTIAIRSTGCFPVRPDPLGGMVIRDGATSASDWKGCLPVERWPGARDPAQGFVASANQQPVDPRATRDYWGGDFDPWRALRINRLLREDSAVTPDRMREWQTDPGSERARWFLPHFVRAGRASTDSAARAAAALLAGWNALYLEDGTRAVLFETAMQELVRLAWDELREPGSASRRVATPSSAMLAVLLDDASNAWWDDRSTTAREDRDAILTQALSTALARVRRDHGEPDAGGWTWGRARPATINHIMRLPGLAVRDLAVRGGPGTLNPSTGRGFGASWRMVVELGPELRAWGVYPGGQSGNPSSARWADRIPMWREGRLEAILSPRTERELAGADRTGALVLTPARAR